MDIKVQLMQLGKRQKDLVSELSKRGMKVTACDVSIALNDDIYHTNKMKAIRESSAEIVEEWRKQEE